MTLTRCAAMALTALLTGMVWFVAPTRAMAPRFFPDDPLKVDPEHQDAAGIKPRDLSQEYDFIENTFKSPGDRRDQRALNVNTIDEVPDSSWYTNRVGTADAMSPEEIVRGPFRHPGPVEGTWTIVSGKSEGVSPGMVARRRERHAVFRQVRSAVESRDGDGCGNRVHAVFLRSGVSHRRESSRLPSPGEPGDWGGRQTAGRLRSPTPDDARRC